MRKFVQFVLCALAIAALIVTGISFYQIVLASTVHGAPVRFIDAPAGPYKIRLTLYSNAINAGDAIPFDIAPAPGTQGPLTYQVTATPGPGVSGSLTQSDLYPQQSTPYGTPGSITFVTRGSWTLHIAVNGPQGPAQANIPVTAVAPPAIPAWIAWNIGLLPAYGLLIFWFVQTRNKRAPKTEETEQTRPLAYSEVKGA